MGTPIQKFAENVLGIAFSELEKREVFIKFIVARGEVIFDPELFVRFEKIHGEGSLNHEDIAHAHAIARHTVEGGAMAAISCGKVRIIGKSRDFGGIDGRIDEIKAFFASRFDCPIIV